MLLFVRFRIPLRAPGRWWTGVPPRGRIRTDPAGTGGYTYHRARLSKGQVKRPYHNYGPARRLWELGLTYVLMRHEDHEMQEVIEFFEMVSLNEAVLRGPEKLSILKARLALRAFNRAMETLKRDLAGAPATAHPNIALPPQFFATGVPPM